MLRTSSAPRPFSQTRPLDVVEVELDPPGPGEVLVRVEAAGICHSDLSVLNGDRLRPLPMALGHEAAGVVSEVGPGVGDVRPGDHVVLVFVPACGLCRHCTSGTPALCVAGAAANGSGDLLGGGSRLHAADGSRIHHHLGVSAFSEYTVVDRRSLVVVDPDVPLEVAALFGCAMLTGYGAAQNTAQVRAGQSVAVFGLGGVGLAAVIGAAVAGAFPIIAVDPVAAKREVALRAGATATFSPEEASEGIAELTGGGAQVAIEAVGSPAVLSQAFTATARGGRTVATGLPNPGSRLDLPALDLIASAKTLMGSYMGSSVPQRDIPGMVALWKAGRLPVEVLNSGEVALQDINAAMDALADARVMRQIVRPHA
ncbi:alcohol dehydrogenase catalytic domain-containing protein [Kineosporia succinea]